MNHGHGNCNPLVDHFGYITFALHLKWRFIVHKHYFAKSWSSPITFESTISAI
uniref:Uncharacterized protein n=1 Tax=Rhizophora mucronata TaxID=61149 RepID=A0A2P2PYH1_RHIMU